MCVFFLGIHKRNNDPQWNKAKCTGQEIKMDLNFIHYMRKYRVFISSVFQINIPSWSILTDSHHLLSKSKWLNATTCSASCCLSFIAKTFTTSEKKKAASINNNLSVAHDVYVVGGWLESCLFVSESVVETWASLFPVFDPWRTFCIAYRQSKRTYILFSVQAKQSHKFLAVNGVPIRPLFGHALMMHCKMQLDQSEHKCTQVVVKTYDKLRLLKLAKAIRSLF